MLENLAKLSNILGSRGKHDTMQKQYAGSALKNSSDSCS